MPKRRLGVAVLLPPDVAAEVDGLRRALGERDLGRIPPHLTLVPPVNVNDQRLDEAIGVVRGAAVANRPFRLTLGPPATFLPDTPVLYLAVSGDVDALVRLRDAVFKPPLERALTWPFVPHVTVVDGAPEERIGDAIAALADFRVEVVVDRVHVLEEGRDRRWTPVADTPLAPAVVVGRGGLDLDLSTTERLDPVAAAFFDREWAAYDAEAYGAEAAVDAPFAITARRDGRVIGAATGEVRGEDAYLARLIVAATERRAGVGAHLLAAVEHHARTRGCRRVTLRTLAGGRAEAFYRSHGWTTYGDLPGWRRGRDFVQLERRLG